MVLVAGLFGFILAALVLQVQLCDLTFPNGYKLGTKYR